MNSVQILDRLIGFPTVSRDSNLALIEYVREFLAARGIESKLYLDAAGRKANPRCGAKHVRRSVPQGHWNCFNVGPVYADVACKAA